MSDVFKTYFLPGLAFMAVVIGGGYSTGRELVQFFGTLGPRGGLLGMCVALCVWSAVLAISFELVRRNQAYEYRSFFKVLLGRGWPLFELAYFCLLLLVLSVIGAAAGAIAHDVLAAPSLVGTLGMMAAIALLVFFGSPVLEKLLAGFAILLYVLYIVIVVWSFASFGPKIVHVFGSASVPDGWLRGGLTYAGYNTAAIPAVFFCLRHQKSRRQAILSGLLAGFIAMTPGILLFISLMSAYPEIRDQQVPLVYLLQSFHASWFATLFQLVLMGILVKTGVALLHSINERFAQLYRERGGEMPRWARSLIALAALLVAIFAASAIGLVDLIAKGYGMLTWAIIALFIAPVMTVGAWKIRDSGTSKSPAQRV